MTDQHNTDEGWQRYRKLPVVIEARGPLVAVEHIETLEGTMRADVGDYVIRGVKGETYPCKPDIFAATYEIAADVPAPPDPPPDRPPSGAVSW